MDMCALKRPWDVQTQPRIVDETLALAALFQAAGQGAITLLRSAAHDFENERNPDRDRAHKVAGWLARSPLASDTPRTIDERVQALRHKGLHPTDALHFAWAEELRADLFITADDRLLRQAARARKALG